MEDAIIQNEHVVAAGKRFCKPVEENLKAVAIEAIVFSEKPLSVFRLDDPVKIEVLATGFCLPNRFHVGKGNAVPFAGVSLNRYLSWQNRRTGRLASVLTLSRRSRRPS
jgi:hypothetical protein